MNRSCYHSYCPLDPRIPAQDPGTEADDGRTGILSRELFYLWNFILLQELWDEAREARDFLDEHMDDPAPFEFDW